MQTSTSLALAITLALGGVCASAQTGAPATGSEAAPARSAGTSPQNPSVNGYKDSKPDSSAGGTPRSQQAQQDLSGVSAMPSDPTSKDSMAKDNKPKHPAADGKKSTDPK